MELPSDAGEEAVSIREVGGIVLYQVEALWIEAAGTKPEVGTLAITQEQLGRYAQRGMATSLAQFRNLVAPGIILARSIFRGLKRPLSANGDLNADRHKLVYSWKPLFDYEWHGDRFRGHPVKRTPPPDRVFVVLVSPNSMGDQFPGVDGWIEHWNWVPEDRALPAAPHDHVNRYEEQLWRRK